MDPINLSRAQAIDGWMSDDELQWLGEQASQCERLIEVGCFLGRSTVVLAEHVQKQMYAVDPWAVAWKQELNGGHHHFFQKHPDIFSEFNLNTRDFQESGKLSVFRGDLKRFRVYRTDLVFIDGSHLYPNVVSDCREGFLRLRNGGILAGHDYGYPSWPAVKSVVDRVFGARVTNPVGSIWAVQV